MTSPAMTHLSKPGPKHGANAAKQLAGDLLAQGFRETQIFADTGLGPALLGQDKPSAPFDQVARFFEHAAQLTGNDILGFQRGQTRDMRKAGLISYLGLSSPTILDAIWNMAHYQRVHSDAVLLDVSRLHSDGIVEWRYAVPQEVERRQFAEFAASGLVHDLRVAANRDFQLQHVCLRHPRRTHLPDFPAYFGCEVRFAQGYNELRFQPEDLHLPLETADAHLLPILREHCELVLGEKGRNLPELVYQVERAIADRLSSGRSTQADVAAALGMSARTLHRRLADEGTSFMAILDNLRAALAKAYLRDSDLTQAEISYLLGYAHVGSFSEAFRRWTGQAPGQYRDS